MILGAVVCLFLHDMAPVYWLLALPLLPILIFMVTLAEIHDEGTGIHVKMLWKSRHLPRTEVLSTNHSYLDGIGELRLRNPVFPWGRIFFVYEWSATQSRKDVPHFYSVLASAVLAISGFVAARAVDISSFRVETSHARALALFSAGTLCALFAIARRKAPSLANSILFLAAYLVGLVRW
jgi:hypothetical protein